MALSTFGFIKLIVTDLVAMAAFYSDVFEFGHSMTFENSDMEEMLLRQEENGLALALLRWKDGRPISLGNAHGPIGFVSTDIAEAVRRALDHGAASLHDIIDVPGTRVAMLADPEGHEIEIVQFI